jgi:hypothetical protein
MALLPDLREGGRCCGEGVEVGCSSDVCDMAGSNHASAPQGRWQWQWPLAKTCGTGPVWRSLGCQSLPSLESRLLLLLAACCQSARERNRSLATESIGDARTAQFPPRR